MEMAEEGISLVDLLPNYPDINDPEFAWHLSQQRELAMLRGPWNQKFPDTGLYNPQEILSRVFSPVTPYDRCGILFEPGVGKTRAITAITEQHVSEQHPALVIVQNDTMKQNFIANLIEGAPGVYNASTEQSKRSLDKAIEVFYNINNMDTFVKEIRKNFSTETHTLDPNFVRAYSNIVIIVDEAHHIKATRETNTNDEKKIEAKLEAAIEKKIRQGYNREEAIRALEETLSYSKLRAKLKALKTKEPLPEITMEALAKVAGDKSIVQWMSTARQTYKAYFLFFHAVENCRIFFLSGTPMVNDRRELAYFFNLFLPIDRQFTSASNAFPEFNLRGDELVQYIAPKLVGMVAFARARFEATTKYKGTPIGDQVIRDENGNEEKIRFTTRLKVCVMSDAQYSAIPNDERDITNLPLSNSFAIKSRNAANFTFPHVEGNKIIYVPGNYKIGKETIFENLVGHSRAKGWYLKASASKDADLLAQLLKSLAPDKLPAIACKYAAIIKKVNSTKWSKDVVYIYNPLVEASGAVIQLLCFVAQGYEQYLGGNIGSLTKNPNRIAIITGLSTYKEIEEIKAVYNHPSNKYGEYLRVVIGSQKSGESISFLNVRRMIIAAPFWHEAAMEQAKKRAKRANSHEAFSDKAEKYLKIYAYAAIYNKLHREVPVDLHLYMMAEKKDRENREILRIAKRCALDGILNKQLNMLDDEQELTPETDYSTSHYTIISGDVRIDGTPIQHNTYINPNNYDLYYDLERKKPIEDILTLFRVHTKLTLEEIHKALPYPYKTLLFALDKLLAEREYFFEVFGYGVYLKEKDNLYFLQSEYGDGDPLLEHYVEYKYLEENKGMTAIYQDAEKHLIEYFLEDAQELDNINERFDELYTLIRNGVAILYEGIIDTTIKVKDNIAQQILERFKGVSLTADIDGSKVLFHKLYYTGKKAKSGDTDYAKGIIELEKRGDRSSIRIYRDDEWRYATSEEDSFFIDTYNTAYKAERSKLNLERVYGIKYMLDNSVSLVFPKETLTGVPLKATKAVQENDKRYLRTGKEITTTDRSLLILVLWHLTKLEVQTATTPAARQALLPIGYNYNAATTTAKRKQYIEDLLGPKKKRNSYNESFTGIDLLSLDPESLYYVWFICHDDHYKGSTEKANSPEDYVLSDLIIERLARLNLLISH